ncbi:sporulation integral membrane protein YlbJ [Metabacillus fastidiosus]|uniref:sporulation integral membrane protein YlbJ n=1 Tax=Metabacillus fastidiosus TaxID=1458 RepID=UPI002E1F43C5|nr:sporulation integral membrane protein YlbJ [Metabacillus fastidiosus]MED4532671.1 sporulation integral membrane protein YlbJ [Metabacillus fastidiosus]
MNRSMVKTIFISFFITSLTTAIILSPEASVEASSHGLKIWWEVVFPSLLPFFILSELLIGFGIVKFIGILLEPIMRPVFRVPGVGGFVWAMGMASGNPAGAKFTARVREEGEISVTEAERLITFTSCANPLFIFGAVAVGFFNNPALGILLAVAHYAGNILVGLTMRFYKSKESTSWKRKKRTFFPPLLTAFRELHLTRIKNKKPIGKMLGEAVLSSVQTLLMIGGFIIIFSVFNRLLTVYQINEFFGIILANFLHVFSLSTELSVPIISGIFEFTLGNQLVSETNAELLDKAIIASFLLAFGGLSVQSQVASILAETDISFKPFFIGRVLQGIYASILTFFLFNPLYTNLESFNVKAVPVFLINEPSYWFGEMWIILSKLGPLITITALLLYILIYGKKVLFPERN